MPRTTQWRSLSIGIAALSAILLFVVGVFKYARVGALHGESADLYVATPEASGVIEGTEVWLAGQKIGLVEEILFGAPTAGAQARVVLRTRVLRSARELVRADSRAELRPGGTIIGAKVLYLSPGSHTAAAIGDADTLRALARDDVGLALNSAESAFVHVPALMADAKTVVGQLRATRARTAALRENAGPLRRTVQQVTTLRSRMTSSQGTLGRLIGERSELIARARSMTASVDSVRTLLASRVESFGRFRRDSTLAPAISRLTDDLAVLRALMNTPTGTIGRLRTDSALVASLDSVHAEMSALVADIKARPLRYIHVF
jgi:phospholipid/cholesterol/gamma-HCH transport system substrate-binding protein